MLVCAKGVDRHSARRRERLASTRGLLPIPAALPIAIDGEFEMWLGEVTVSSAATPPRCSQMTGCHDTPSGVEEEPAEDEGCSPAP